MITTLAGGGGAAKFLRGLVRVASPGDITVIVNTGDDSEFYDLYVCPDLDIITYTLAGVLDEQKGWGFRDESFNFLETIRKYGEEAWFSLGDRDLATHIHRTRLLRQGLSLTEVADRIRRAWGVQSRILPMSDAPVRTRFLTPAGELAFQEYFVKRRAGDAVEGVIFQGSERAAPAPGVREAILNAEHIIICPSNPIISIGIILSVPGVREALKETKAPIAAISPIVGGKSLKGPSDRIMSGLGLEVSALGVAKLYQDFVDIFVIDTVDAASRAHIEALGLRVIVTNTIMGDAGLAAELGRQTLAGLECCR